MQGLAFYKQEFAWKFLGEFFQLGFQESFFLCKRVSHGHLS